MLFARKNKRPSFKSKFNAGAACSGAAHLPLRIRFIRNWKKAVRIRYSYVPSPIFIKSILIIYSDEQIIPSNYFIYLWKNETYLKNFPNWILEEKKTSTGCCSWNIIDKLQNKTKRRGIISSVFFYFITAIMMVTPYLKYWVKAFL